METSRDWERLVRVPDGYSMDTAVRLLTSLENKGCATKDRSWKSKGHGHLVENGIEITCGNMVIALMCSYEDIFIKRVSGNKARYYELCEALRQWSGKSAQ